MIPPNNNSVATIVALALLVCISGADAALNTPPVSNAGFEDNVLVAGQRIFNFDAWYDSQCWIEYATGSPGNGIPLTPDGNQWCGLPGNGRSSNAGYIYQQIGIYDGQETVDITFLVGKRQDVAICPLRVALWVGGDEALARNDFTLGTMGASRVDTISVTPDFEGENISLRELQLALSSGTGHTPGDPIWIEFKSDGISSAAQLFIDHIRIGHLKTAGNPQPANNARRVPIDQILDWTQPDVPGSACDLYFGTNPDITSNPQTTDVVPPFDPGSLDYLTTYYWRLDTIDGSETHTGTEWNFTTGGKATNPVPFNDTVVPMTPTIDLAWQADPWATSFKVYMATGFPLQYRAEVTEPALTGLAILKANTIYHWRVDEYVDDQMTVEGSLWQFTTGSRPALACPAGDLDGDCTVDGTDLMLLALQWLQPDDCAGQRPDCADIAASPGVDIADFALMADDWGSQGGAAVVINEIHYDPDVKTQLVEFVELHNAGTVDADLSGWYFGDGIDYTFPAGTILKAGEYLVAAEDPTAAWSPVTISQKFGTNAAKVFGPFTGNLRNRGEKIELYDADGNEADQVDYQLGFPWPTVGDPAAAAGTGHSMQLIHPNLDNDLGGSWRSAYPTPAAENASVFAISTPPHIRQVKHSPKQPLSNESVTITAKVTDADGVDSVTLKYQLVNPGQYIRRIDSQYNTSWTSVAMHDDGLDGDQQAGDDIFTVQLPPSIQNHRRLVRYRIVVEDTFGNTLTVPYSDDPQPNFAYFVYDGVPAWRGALEPASGDPARSEVITFTAEVMRSLPTYHLIALESDVIKCQYNGGYENARFLGTMVYEGVVYDHIEYKIRGEWSTYQSGKNKWKLFFTRGHDFQARDDYGKKFDSRWRVINLGACATPWMPINRGMAIDEALAFALYNMAGVPSPKTNALQFRVIDRSVEASSSDQYEGDLWGLYMTIEYPDGRFLNEHNLPDGNTYKMESGGDQKNQGPTQPSNGSDLSAFRNGYNQTNTVAWWKQNLNLRHYYGFRSINRAINNSDIREGWNSYYYHDPETNLWTVIPWDLDMLWTPVTHWSGVLNIQNCLNHQEFAIGYRNYGRHLQDLLLSSDQIGQIVDELASIVNPPGWTLTMVDVDEFLWNYHPRTAGGHRGKFYKTPYVHGDFGDQNITRTLASADHEGSMGWLKFFLTPVTAPLPWTGTSYLGADNGYDFLDGETSDSAIPNTPAITYTGGAGFPVNDLQFSTSAFSDPQGTGTFAATKWRIAEVEPTSSYVPPPDNNNTILIQEDSTWRYFKGTQEPSNPTTAWRRFNFNDDPLTTDWLEGQLPIGYGDASANTTLSDMRYNYTSVYLRKKFEVIDPSEFESIRFNIRYDEGFNIWINETLVASEKVGGENVPYNSTATDYVSGRASTVITRSDPQAYLVSGTNIITVQLLNSAIGSSDLFLSLVLTGNPPDPGNGDPPPSPFYGKRGKYEIDALWESQDITDPAGLTVTVPAGGIRPGKTYRLRCKMMDSTGRWSHWSDPNQFIAGEPLSVGILDNLRITEVMYNPAPPNIAKGEMDVDNDQFEFVELKNIGDESLNLTHVSFVEGIAFDFATSPVKNLTPGAFLLVVRNKTAFESRYGTAWSSRIAGEYSTAPDSDGRKLSNSGEMVTLEDYYNGIIAEFDYNDGRGWPISADGGGHSLVPLNSSLAGQPNGSCKYGGNWRASSNINGTPGADDPAGPIDIVINEIMAHTDYSDPANPEYDSNDWIELYNASGSDIVLDGDWYLSDDIDQLKKWAIPNTLISSGDHASFDEVTGFHNPITSGFGLNKAKEQVFLSYLPGTSDDRIVDYVKFKGQQSFVSWGRYPDGGAYWFALVPSRSQANIDPILSVVISEVMYNPPIATGDAYDSQEYEYVELYNPTTQPVDLFSDQGSWQLDGAVSYTFPPATSIGPAEFIVIARNTAAFYDKHGFYPDGQFQGNLSNGGERLTLEWPEAPDLPDNPDIPWIIADEVIYGDYAPWPTSADGDGHALHRTSTDAAISGNDPTNWQPAAPSPGQ